MSFILVKSSNNEDILTIEQVELLYVILANLVFTILGGFCI